MSPLIAIEAMWLALQGRVPGICHHLGVGRDVSGVRVGLSPSPSHNLKGRWKGCLLVTVYGPNVSGRYVARIRRELSARLGWRCVAMWNGGRSFVVSAKCPESLEGAIGRYRAMRDVFAPTVAERCMFEVFHGCFSRRLERYANTVMRR
jgi:hypothetical protein